MKLRSLLKSGPGVALGVCDEAENRMHTIKALMIATIGEEPL